jgi:hypothetical protein
MTSYNRSVDLDHMPERIRNLPISPEGFPVPWFVEWFDKGKPCSRGYGVPDFRITDPSKITAAVRMNLCWVCGNRGGTNKAFVIGPMCAINRVISEPASHRECAIYAARVCPFLSKPNMVRNTKGIMQDGKLVENFTPPPGFGLSRNPGAVCVWVTKTFKMFRPPSIPGSTPGVLFSLGDPIETLWFAEGRPATRAEVLASIDSGYPKLEDIARLQGAEALAALPAMRAEALALLPV